VGPHNGILLTGNYNEIYGHFTLMMSAGPFQCKGAQPSFFVQVRAFKVVAENQKSKSTGSNSRYRWNVLGQDVGVTPSASTTIPATPPE